MCCNEPWVLYKTDESQTYTLETSNTLYINLKSKKIKIMLGFYLKWL